MASRKASSLFSWDAENRGSERRRETLRHGQQISNVQNDRCQFAARTRFETACLYEQCSSRASKVDTVSRGPLRTRTNRHIRLTTANACALQCSSLTVSTASACGDCNVPVTRTFLPRNFFRREILVNRYAWGLDSSVRKNMWLQSTIVPTTFRCTSPSEPLERPSEQSAISEGAVAS